jgi:hypothetical protein
MASRPIPEYIDAMCPRLAEDPLIDLYIELATDRTSPTFFGPTFTNYAIALRAMHDFTLYFDRKRGEAGFITDRTEGRVSKRYLHNMSRASRNDLAMTVYGQRLHALIRARGPIMLTAVSNLNEDAAFVEVEY